MTKIPGSVTIFEMDIRFIAGSLSLDFLNTVHNYNASDPREELKEMKDLVIWARRAGILNAKDARSILYESRKRPGEAERFLQETQKLRNSIYSMFFAISRNHPIDSRALKRIRRHLSRSMMQMTVRRDRGRYRLLSSNEETPANRFLFIILESTLRLLMSHQDLLRLRQCEGENCTWLFLDRSKNRSRRWCEMQSCGSRAKSRRYYSRKKKRE